MKKLSVFILVLVMVFMFSGVASAGFDGRLAKESVINDISNLLPTGDKKNDNRIEKAIRHLEKCLSTDLWEKEFLLTKKGKKVFDEEKKAVKELMKILKHKHTDDVIKSAALEAIDSIVSIDETLAQITTYIATETAEENGCYDEENGEHECRKALKEIAKTQKEIDKAQKELNHTKKDGTPDPKYDKAIDHYKKAWEHAQRILGGSPGSCDDDSDKKKGTKVPFLTGCHDLSVNMTGTGSGKVVSNPAGIFCDSDCSETLLNGEQVTLTASSFSRSTFTGWNGGGCTGLGPCTLSLTANTLVTANFELASDTVTDLPTPYVNHNDIRSIRGGFVTDHTLPPYYRLHDGLDIYPEVDLAPFQAVCEGRIKKIFALDDLVMVWLQCTSSLFFEYNFESQAPGTGATQLGYINFGEGQGVSKYDVIGSLYAPNEEAHVHFSMYENMIPSCVESYLTPAAKTSIDLLGKVVHPDSEICSGPPPVFPAMPTPYVFEGDMLFIDKGFSSSLATSPWGGENNGFDIYPAGDYKAFQATCDGRVDSVDLTQSPNGRWEVSVLVQCDDYVYTPQPEGYFIPFATRYIFETMSSNPTHGQEQLARIQVVQDSEVSQGDIIGELKVFNDQSHLEFGTSEFAGKAFSWVPEAEVPFCPEAHFASTARASMLNLLSKEWTHAHLCYQH